LSRREGALSLSHGTVKTHPEISREALREGLHREIALWYALRAIDKTGSGKVDVSEARQALKDIYPRRSFYRILRSGKDIFWETFEGKRGSRIRIFGLYSVASYFGIPYLTRPYTMPFKMLKKTQTRKALLYASALCHIKKPISRLSIQEMTGITPQKQRVLEKRAGIEKHPNFAVTREPPKRRRTAVMEGGGPTHFEYNHERPGGDPPGEKRPELMIVEGRKRWIKDRRLPNNYKTQAQPAGRSLTKKVNKRIKEAAKSLLMAGQEEPPFFIRFFNDNKKFERVSSFRKTSQREGTHDDPFIWVRPGDRLRRGRLEWEWALNVPERFPT